MEPDASQLRAVAAAYSAFARGDVRGLLDSLSENVIWDATDALWVKGTFFGRAGARNYLSEVQALWEDLRLEDYEMEMVRPGTILVRGRLRGKDRTTGQTADSAFVHWVDLGADGRIAQLRILVDPDRHDT